MKKLREIFPFIVKNKILRSLLKFAEKENYPGLKHLIEEMISAAEGRSDFERVTGAFLKTVSARDKLEGVLALALYAGFNIHAAITAFEDFERDMRPVEFTFYFLSMDEESLRLIIESLNHLNSVLPSWSMMAARNILDRLHIGVLDAYFSSEAEESTLRRILEILDKLASLSGRPEDYLIVLGLKARMEVRFLSYKHASEEIVDDADRILSLINSCRSGIVLALFSSSIRELADSKGAPEIKQLVKETAFKSLELARLGDLNAIPAFITAAEALWKLSKPDEFRDFSKSFEELATGIKDEGLRALILTTLYTLLSVSESGRGNFEEASKLIRLAISHAEKASFVSYDNILSLRFKLGETLIKSGKVREGLEVLMNAFKEAVELEDYELAFDFLDVVDWLIVEGNVEELSWFIDSLLEYAKRKNDLLVEFKLRMLSLALKLVVANFSAAEEEIPRVVDILERIAMEHGDMLELLDGEISLLISMLVKMDKIDLAERVAKLVSKAVEGGKLRMTAPLYYLAKAKSLLGKAKESEIERLLVKVEEAAEEAVDEDLLLNLYLEFADIYLSLGNLERAREYVQKIIEMARMSAEPSKKLVLIRAHSLLSQIYGLEKRLLEAIRESEAAYKETTSVRSLYMSPIAAIMALSLAEQYMALGDKDRAVEILEEALENINKTGKSTILVAFSRMLGAYLDFIEGDFDSAFRNLEDALKLFEEAGVNDVSSFGKAKRLYLKLLCRENESKALSEYEKDIETLIERAKKSGLSELERGFLTDLLLDYADCVESALNAIEVSDRLSLAKRALKILQEALPLIEKDEVKALEEYLEELKEIADSSPTAS